MRRSLCFKRSFVTRQRFTYIFRYQIAAKCNLYSVVLAFCNLSLKGEIARQIIWFRIINARRAFCLYTSLNSITTCCSVGRWRINVCITLSHTFIRVAAKVKGQTVNRNLNASWQRLSVTAFTRSSYGKYAGNSRRCNTYNPLWRVKQYAIGKSVLIDIISVIYFNCYIPA